VVFERVIISQHALDVVYGPGTVLTVNHTVFFLSSASSIQERRAKSSVHCPLSGSKLSVLQQTGVSKTSTTTIDRSCH
jgi:hypothetical protein